jgi:predicted ATPase
VSRTSSDKAWAALPDAQWSALDPLQRRQHTLDAVKRLLLRESQVQPLLLVFEALHWIDSETRALLDELVESLPGARVLLLVNYRPEYRLLGHSHVLHADPTRPLAAGNRHVAQLLNQHIESRGEEVKQHALGQLSQRGLESITGAPIRQHGTRFVLWDQAQQTTPHRIVRERGSSGKENRNP